jgi:hypothetical protein
MNFFSTDVYLKTLAQVCFPNRSSRIGLFQVDGRVLRMLEVDGKPISSWPFLDFFQPLPDGGSARPLAWVPRAVLRTARIDERPPLERGIQPSPYIDWTLFPAWSDFLALVKQRRSGLIGDSRRRRGRLEREVGPFEFRFDDERPEAMETCFSWKGAQYISTGGRDLFSDRRNTELFRALRRAGALAVSTLSAGGRLIAAHLGAIADGSLYWWVPAYDPAYAKYSAGRLMLESMLEQSHALGHKQFDFLIGDEDYKWHYATHNREIGPLGTPPLRVRARAAVRNVLSSHPRLQAAARSLKKRLTR